MKKEKMSHKSARKVNSSKHPDVKEDKKLVKKMVKKDCLK